LISQVGYPELIEGVEGDEGADGDEWFMHLAGTHK
jgi:hypothetical protein